MAGSTSTRATLAQALHHKLTSLSCRPFRVALQTGAEKPMDSSKGFVSLAVLGFALAIFASPAVGQAVAGSEVRSERLAADTPFTTASGATFTAPVDWSVTSSANKRVVTSP